MLVPVRVSGGHAGHPTESDVVVCTGIAGVEGAGPFFEVTLALYDGLVADIRTRSLGCMWSDLTGLALASLVHRKPLDQVRGVTEDALRLRLIDALPARREMLPGLAMAALRQAVGAVFPPVGATADVGRVRTPIGLESGSTNSPRIVP